ncbi:MAG: GMC oxidoreductase [Pseudomonadota bacterium]
MINELDSQHVQAHADVVVIGAGIAGLILAQKLDERGIRVAVIESGGWKPSECDSLFSDVSFSRRRYNGALEGRSRCLGGTSVKWGGALMPFQATDYTNRPKFGHIGWPIDPEEISSFIPQVESLFGLEHDEYDALLPQVFQPDASQEFKAREAKWPRFPDRNVATLFADNLRRSDQQQIWLNSHVTSFSFNQGRLNKVVATNSKGGELSVLARYFVICAGAVETTRLMLMLESSNEGAILGNAHLGKYLQDHLSYPLATLNSVDKRKTNSLAGFRFDGQVMRSLRFERAVAGKPSAFVHIAPKSSGRSGFDAAKDFMRSIQRREPQFGAMFRAAADIPYMTELAYWRFKKKRLLWPTSAKHEVHIVVEQAARKENSIRLSNERDSMGVPKVVIDWDLGKQDLEIFREVCGRFDMFWKSSNWSVLGALEWIEDPWELQFSDIEGADDVYHPVGTTRMAFDAGAGVVDGDLKVFGVENLHLAATSVFPNGGTANPTMTLILLVLRLSNFLSRQLMRSK